MKFTPKREKDGGLVINWLADRAMDLSSWLTKISMNYALVYEVDFTDEDGPGQPKGCECGRDGSCCND